MKQVPPCPGEGCRYGGRWEVQHSTELRSLPRNDATVIATLAPRQIVTAVTGEVHTIPGRYVVKRDHTSRRGDTYASGDVLLVHTYLGEGLFRVEFEGRRYMEGLRFSPWGGSTGNRCQEDDEYCWGELEEELEFNWWVHVQTEDGRDGSTHESQNFDKELFRLARLSGWRPRWHRTRRDRRVHERASDEVRRLRGGATLAPDWTRDSA